MPTTLFMRGFFYPSDEAPTDLSSDTDLALDSSRGPTAQSAQTSTVAGPTSGRQVNPGVPLSWWYRVNAVTISGSITKNLRMSETNMSANVGAQIIIDRHDSAGTFVSTVANHERGTELVVTTETAENWSTGTVTSTSFSDGDYIRVRVYGNDVGTMASGYFFHFYYDGPTAAASGDSYVTFTETITAYTPAAERVPRFSPYPQLLGH